MVIGAQRAKMTIWHKFFFSTVFLQTFNSLLRKQLLLRSLTNGNCLVKQNAIYRFTFFQLFRVSQQSFRNQPGKLSLTLKCVSAISNLDKYPRYSDVRHQKESTHFSIGSLFHSGKPRTYDFLSIVQPYDEKTCFFYSPNYE